MAWLCSTSVDWNAISAIATVLAVIVALGFGVRESVAHWLLRKRRRIYIATAVMHPLLVARNQCKAVANVLSAADIDRHRAQIRDLGRAIHITAVDTLARHGAESELFGGRGAAAYGYAVSLMEDMNVFARWLTTIEVMTEAAWAIVKEQSGFIPEAANQACESLSIAEAAVKPYVPAQVIVLRFGPNGAGKL